MQNENARRGALSALPAKMVKVVEMVTAVTSRPVDQLKILAGASSRRVVQNLCYGEYLHRCVRIHPLALITPLYLIMLPLYSFILRRNDSNTLSSLTTGDFFQSSLARLRAYHTAPKIVRHNQSSSRLLPSSAARSRHSNASSKADEGRPYKFEWKLHSMKKPARVQSVRVTIGYLGRRDPKYGSRLMANALVTFKSMQVCFLSCSLPLFSPNMFFRIRGRISNATPFFALSRSSN